MSTWYTAVARGVAALILALVCLAHPLAPLASRADAFAAYAVADGILCGLALIVSWTHRDRFLPLLAGGAGISVGIYLLSLPSLSPRTISLVVAAWGLVIGIVSLETGRALYHSVPGPWRVVALTSGVWVRRGAATERGILLAGMLALAFAVTVLMFAARGAAVSLAFVGLFAAAFGYLHLRTGLTLGALALAVAESERPTGDRVVAPELDAGANQHALGDMS